MLKFNNIELNPKMPEEAKHTPHQISLPKTTAQNPAIGPTEELTLRISSACFAKVHFKHPTSGEEMLVLERKCVAHITESAEVKYQLQAQPIGGACRLHDEEAFLRLSGGFNYDSEKSLNERDFRLLIAPSSWPSVRDFCIKQSIKEKSAIIESDIKREFTEEIKEALGKDIKRKDWCSKKLGIVICERAPKSVRLDSTAAPSATKKIINIFDVEIRDKRLIRNILKNHISISNKVLLDKALKKARENKRPFGKATALMVVPQRALALAFSHRKNTINDKMCLMGLKLSHTVETILKFSKKP